MAGKKRSGLANDRRAYGCGRCYTPTPTPCGVIDIGSIATNDGENTYTLNGNYTIAECQILNIPIGITLNVSAGQTLTNVGIINNSGSIHNNGTIQNNGTINNSGIIFNYGGTINNNTGGTINNSSYIYNPTSGILNNSGTIDNSGYLYNGIVGGGGTINNNTGGFIYTYGSGAIFNNSPGTINNNAGGFIYTYGGGNIFNDLGATLNNNVGGTISTSNGGTCGAGYIQGLGTFTGVIPTNTNCPP
jgi:hypothetical protein